MILLLAAHLAFGLPALSPFDVYHDGQRIEQSIVSSEDGVLRFNADGPGRFAIVPADTVTVPVCPDLEPMEWNIPVVECVGLIRARVRVQNTGPGPAAGSTVEFRLDGTPFATSPIASLAPGQWAWSQWVQVTRPPGDYRIVACVDALGQILEEDESNNCTP